MQLDAPSALLPPAHIYHQDGEVPFMLCCSTGINSTTEESNFCCADSFGLGRRDSPSRSPRFQATNSTETCAGWMYQVARILSRQHAC